MKKYTLLFCLALYLLCDISLHAQTVTQIDTLTRVSGGRSPISMAIDATSGYLYIANEYKSTISQINLSGTGLIIQSWATLVSGADPAGIATDASGNVYTANQNGTISKITSSGSVADPWITLANNAIPSGGITIDGNGNIYTANNNHSISKITSSGTETQVQIISSLEAARAIIADKTGNVYIATQENGSAGGEVIKRTVSGATSSWPLYVSPNTNAFVSLAIDKTSNLYISYPNSDYNGRFVIAQITSSGTETARWAVMATNPQAIVTDETGNVYTFNTDATISKITSSGVITYPWASSVSGSPNAMAIDREGNLYTAFAGSVTNNGVVNKIVSIKTWYVQQNATGGGISWSDASGDLQAIINNANAGDSIFVASGTYKPASNTSFSMKAGVKIYGSFAGTETSLSQRQFNTSNPLFAIESSILLGNGSSVIYNNGLDSSAVLDGFLIEAGVGISNNGTTSGGGIYNQSSSPTISNCQIADNEAGFGGGMYNSPGSSPHILNCLFDYNDGRSGGGGGAVLDEGGATTFTKCIFYDNYVTSSDGTSGSGGAYQSQFNNGYCIFTNCLFSLNQAKGSYDAGGGALMIDGNGEQIVLNNCTLYNNTTTASPAASGFIGNTITINPAIYGTPSLASKVTLHNSIIWGSESTEIDPGDGNFTFSYSLVKGYESDTALHNIQGAINPLLLGNGGFSAELQTSSPCINSGDTTGMSAFATDLFGNPRITNGMIDMGAYQSLGFVMDKIPGQSIISNESDTTSDGWLYLLNDSTNHLVCAVNPNGQNLGSISGIGTLTDNYGSGNSTAFINPFGQVGQFSIINRAWQVEVGNASFSNPVSVRYFIDSSDLKDLAGVLPAGTLLPHDLASWKQFAPLIILYKVAGDNAYDPSASNYKQYKYAEDNLTADTAHFVIGAYQGIFYLEFQVNTFSSGALAYAPSLLPVILTSFTGNLQNGVAILQWKTGVESNFNHFEVQKSTDGKSFVSVVNISAKGSNSSYSYTLPQTEATVYYRLKLVDNDGYTKYSNVITLMQGSDNIVLYPNPANTFIRINVKKSDVISIYSENGNLVKIQSIAAGINTLDIHSLAAGNYYIVTGNNQKMKFVKE